MSSGAGFYEAAYRPDADERERFTRWRELGARGKAEHVIELAGRVGVRPQRVLDVGCGDGAVLAELARREFGSEYAAFDVAESAIEAVRARGLPGLRRAEVFDGQRLPVEHGAFDLGVLSHVLEHVEHPQELLAETARAAETVVVEVPLEQNVSAGRERIGEVRAEIGHLQRFDRADVHALVAGAGLAIRGELTDPLDRRFQLFFATTAAARARALAKAAVRRAAFTLSRRLAERLFTVHYACVASRPRGDA